MGETSGQRQEGVFADETVVEASDTLVSTAVGEDEILLDTDAGVYYEANSVGRRILELVHEGARVGTICEIITTEYDVDAETCRDDVTSFLTALQRADLVDVTETT